MMLWITLFVAMNINKFANQCLLLILFCIGQQAFGQSTNKSIGSDGYVNLDLDGNAEQKPKWSVSIEAIALSHTSSVNQNLVSQVGNTETFGSTANSENSMPLLNNNQLRYGYGVGPKLTINYQADSRYGFEASYFSVLNMNASQTVGPNSNWLTMYAPGFWQTQDYPYQGMNWSSTTGLNSAEASIKKKLSPDFSWIAGLRWIRLKDSLTGSVTPADQYFPAWKDGSISPVACPSVGGVLYDPTFQALNNCSNLQTLNQPINFSNFWSTNTVNNLFGMQIGGQGVLFRIGQFSIEGSLKVGLYDNFANQDTAASLKKTMYFAGASANQLAYSGDGVIQLKYQVTRDVKLKLGYQLLWINQVALAAGQVSKSYSTSIPSLTVNGVNTSSSVLFQGGTVGFEYVF